MQLHAHNGSEFQTWITLNILPFDIPIVKSGKVVFKFKKN